jgi:uncharacterized damage-inducible protein DinB
MTSYVVPTPAEVDGPMTGADREILRGYLRWQRSTLLNVCAGLSGAQLAARPLPSSALSLLGLVRHLAKVERIWLRQRAAGEEVPPLHGGAGHPADFADGHADDAAAEIRALQDEWAAADRAVDDLPWTHEIEAGGERMSLGMIHVHLIGEYARHNGHADLLREAIDGTTGR